VKPGAGDNGRPFGVNFARLPSRRASDACEPTMKFAPVQIFPTLSNMILPGALRPPPVNFSPMSQALGA
jgi:hypothetical protein